MSHRLVYIKTVFPSRGLSKISIDETKISATTCKSSFLSTPLTSQSRNYTVMESNETKHFNKNSL